MAKSLRYPLATLTKESDYLFMTIEKYKPSGFEGNQLRQRLSRGLGNTRATTQASIILPIPTTITDSNGISWGSGTLNAFERSALGGATDAMTGDIAQSLGELKTTGAELFGTAKDIGKERILSGLVSSQKLFRGLVATLLWSSFSKENWTSFEP